MTIPTSLSTDIDPDATVFEESSGDLQFPSDLNGADPYIAFMSHRPKYNTSGSTILEEQGEQSVALYVPPGISIDDSISYEGNEEGLFGAGLDRFQQGTLTDVDMDDIKSLATERANDLAAAAAAAVGGLTSGYAGAMLGAAAGNADTLKAIAQRNRGRVLNPREFMLFKSPDMRSFSFEFRMIPKRPGESRTVTEIIKFFRKASYPSVTEGGIDFAFPDAFTIRFGNLPSFIKIPEVVCTGVNVTYNPTSPSYFDSSTLEDNEAVETTLSLSFKELKPITKNFVDEGY